MERNLLLREVNYLNLPPIQGHGHNFLCGHHETQEQEYISYLRAKEGEYMFEFENSSTPASIANVPFAPEPPFGSYWPLITKRESIVSFKTTDGKFLGMAGRSFGANRTDGGRHHVGIDLFANYKDPVIACQKGKIVNFYHFYHGAYCLVIEHDEIVINYGEVSKNLPDNVRIGSTVEAGQVIAYVGKMSGGSSMLHFETYKKGVKENIRWYKNKKPSSNILNPTKYLLFLKNNGLNQTAQSTSTATSQVSSSLQKAVASNRQYGAELSWDKYIYEINDLLLPYSGQSNVSLSEEAIVEALKGWQRANSLTADGILGPKTWAKMKPFLVSKTTPTVPVSPSFVTTGGMSQDILVGLLDFFGYQPKIVGITTALSNFQKDKGISPASGKLGSITEKRLEQLKEKLRYAKKAGIDPQRFNRFRLTHYYVVDENDYPSTSETVPVLNKSGVIMAYVNPDFYLDLCIEGSGRTKDGRMLNVAGSSVNVSDYSQYTQFVLPKAQKRYARNFKYTGLSILAGKVSKALAFSFKADTGKFGYGVLRKISLEPFRTLAADIGLKSGSEPKFKGKGGLVPAKTRVFILDLAGEKMPDGSVHDGWCVVNDTGGAINGTHFDVFTGTKELRNQVNIPHIGQIWFEGMEQKIDANYQYGLFKNS